MTFFRFKIKLYPLIAIAASLFVIIFGLVAARNENLCWYLLGVLVWLCIFGCFKGVLKMLPAFVVFGGAFAGIAYASAGGDLQAALSMLNRFGALFLGVALSMSVAAVRMTRSLSQVHIPRAITLGMLISMSFVPMLKGEIGRVREAMKTRGAGSVLNPKILYAFSTLKYSTAPFWCRSLCGLSTFRTRSRCPSKRAALRWAAVCILSIKRNIPLFPMCCLF